MENALHCFAHCSRSFVSEIYLSFSFRHVNLRKIPRRLLHIIILHADFNERRIPYRALLLISKRKQNIPEPPLRQSPHLQAPKPTFTSNETPTFSREL